MRRSGSPYIRVTPVSVLRSRKEPVTGPVPFPGWILSWLPVVTIMADFFSGSVCKQATSTSQQAWGQTWKWDPRTPVPVVSSQAPAVVDKA